MAKKNRDARYSDAFGNLLNRSGLVKKAVAQTLGYKQASGLQRYYESYDGPLPLHLVRALVPILAGRGEPPITAQEVWDLANTGLPYLTDWHVDVLQHADKIRAANKAASDQLLEFMKSWGEREHPPPEGRQLGKAAPQQAVAGPFPRRHGRGAGD